MVAVLFALSMAVAPPKLPVDFYTGVQGVIVTAPGSYAAKDAACCAKDSPNCQIITQTMGADIFQQGSRNRTLHQGAQGIVLEWAAPVHKIMTLLPGSAVNSTHKWACAGYCEMTDPFRDEVALPSKVKYLGKKTVAQPEGAGGTTKRCDTFEWTEKLIKILPLSNEYAYVDESKPSAPGMFKRVSTFTHVIEKLTHEASSTKNMSYIGFDASFDVAAELDVDMDSVATCKKIDPDKSDCPEAPGVAAMRAALTQLGGSPKSPKTTVRPASARGGASGGAPVFFPSYSARKLYSSRTAQGNFVSAGGDPCCSFVDAPVCEVQLSNSRTMEYQDAESQRTRTEDSDGTVRVHDFNTNRSMLINVSGSVDTCISYCPIDQELDPPPSARTLPGGVVDKGPVLFDGQQVEWFQWSETVFKILKVATISLYVKLAANGSAVPVFESEVQFPLGGGKSLGVQNITWESFVPGRPPASKFAIAGVEACPKAKDCEE
jgi:hypothetical protein